MERKIGEILEYEGEWYQCVKSLDGSCKDCDMNFDGKCPIPIKDCTESGRKDKTYVIFKKLEKVGGPYNKLNIMVQKYKVNIPVEMPDEPYMYFNLIESTIEIGIKQSQGNMGENKLNFRPFDLEAAKAGKPVCTGDGQKARIICFDRKGLYPIVALIEYGDKDERIGAFSNEGRTDIYEMRDVDLVMLPEKHEGWINIFDPSGKDNSSYLATCGCVVYKTKEAAIAGAVPHGYIATVKIEWEE